MTPDTPGLTRYVVHGSSMLPTLSPGRRLLVDSNAYLGHGPERGDIVVFRHPLPRIQERIGVLRVIAVPAEEIQIREGNVYLNGELLDEPYVVHRASYSFAPRKVPRGKYFVLGDRRSSSFDSHVWLPPWLPRNAIIGKVVADLGTEDR